ncbi:MULTISPECIES: DoxX family protein [Sphingobacterium]|nr:MULTISPECIES: DoxX family protein [Sphingobacterium]
MESVNNFQNKFGMSTYVVARVLIGLFFTITGFNKLFHPIFQERMLNTISKIGFPYPQFTANFTATFECIFGLFLLIGLFTRISSAGLIIIILVALISHDLNSIPKELLPSLDAGKIYPMDPFTWLSYFLYLPQVLYLLLLFIFLGYGYGKVGFDRYVQK